MDAYEHEMLRLNRMTKLPSMGPYMTEMQGHVAVTDICRSCGYSGRMCVCKRNHGGPTDRAVHNSLPPMDDVGEDVHFMLDEADPDFHYSDVNVLLDEREKTHGSFAWNAYYGQLLREIFRGSEGWKNADARQREALDYFAGKISRILSGQPGHTDHWEDIAGYAKLAAHPDQQR